jgi:hypothetical protein
MSSPTSLFRQEKGHHSALPARADMEVDTWFQRAVELNIPKVADFDTTIATHGQMPNSVVVPVVLLKQLVPLLSGQTGIVLGFALPIMGLEQTDEPFGLRVHAFGMLCLLLLQFTQLFLGEANLLDGPLPAALAPPFEVLLDALAFGHAEPQDFHHLTLSESVYGRTTPSVHRG